MTTMTDNREVDFGKKTALYNVTHEDGVSIVGAFVDGEYRTFTVAEDKVAEWAAYGLRQFVKGLNLADSAAFDAKANLAAGPFATQPRASKGTASLPIERALMAVTGKSLEAVRAFLASKSRKEVNALKADARIAPVYAAEQAAVLAKRAAAKAAPDAPAADLLDGLTAEPETSTDEASE